MSFFSVPRQPLAVALALSLGLHGIVGVWVKVRPSGDEHPEAPRPDVWAGRGIDIDRTELEEAPVVVAPSDPALEAPEATTGAPVERSASEEACVTNCIADTTPRSTDRAKPDEPKTASSVRAPSATTREPRASAAASAASVAVPSASVAAPSASLTASAAASSAASGAPNDPFGAVGLPAGVRFLPKAYTRALNQGSWRVAGFRSVAVGKLCEARVSIAVGEDRRLGPLEYSSEPERDALPALCRTMLENGYRLVSAGEFSLDPKRLEDGVMRLRVEIEVSDGAAHPDAERGPHELFSESQEPPSPGKRGRSTFILNSGRRVDAFIDIE